MKIYSRPSDKKWFIGMGPDKAWGDQLDLWGPVSTFVPPGKLSLWGPGSTYRGDQKPPNSKPKKKFVVKWLLATLVQCREREESNFCFSILRSSGFLVVSFSRDLFENCCVFRVWTTAIFRLNQNILYTRLDCRLISKQWELRSSVRANNEKQIAHLQ